MKKRKIIFLLPLFSLLLGGCDLTSIYGRIYDLGHKLTDPIVDKITGNEGDKKDDGGDQKEATAVSITEIIGLPESIKQGETLATTGLTAKVKYSDNSEKTEDVTKIELDTSKVGDATGKAFVGTLSKDFTIAVTADDVTPIVNYGAEANPLTVTQALAIINNECVKDGDVSKQAIVLQGEVKEIKKIHTYTEGPSFEFIITDGTSDIYVYRCLGTEELKANFEVGSVVKLSAIAKNFKGTLELADGENVKSTLIAAAKSVKVISEITSVTAPENISLNASLLAGTVNVVVKYTDNSTATIHPDSIDLDTSVAGEVTGTVHVGELTKPFTITVTAPKENKFAEAYAAAKALSSGETDEYYFEGVVVGKRGDDTFIQNDVYGIDVYKSTVAVEVGDKIGVTSTLKNFNGMPETATLKSVESLGKGTVPEAAKITSKTLQQGLNISVLCEIEAKVKELPAYTSGDYKFKVCIGDDEFLIFVKSSLYSAFQSKLGTLAVGDDVKLSNAITSIYQTDLQIALTTTSLIEKITHPVESVSLDKSTLTVEAGSAPVTLVPTVAPENATNKEVTWTSSNEDAATVADGVVTPVAEGETTITVTTADGGKTATCVVTVTAATKTLTGITVTGPNKVEYTEGDKLDLTGLVVNAVYDSGDPEVISTGYTTSIDTNTALATTDTSFTVSYGGFTSDSISITVSKKQVITDEITAEAFGVTGTSYAEFSNKELTSGAKYSGKVAKNKDYGVIQLNNSERGIYSRDSLRILKSVSVTFNSNTTDAREVQIYALHGNFKSTQDTSNATLVATFKKASDNLEFSYTFTDTSEATGYTNILIRANNAVYLDELNVNWSSTTATAFIYGVSLDKTEVAMNMGEPQTITATVDGAGTDFDKITWSSNDTSKVTVENGVLTPVAVTDSPVTITAMSNVDNTVKAECSVTVSAARTLTALTTEGGFKTTYSADDNAFAIDDLKVFANYDNNDVEEVTDYSISWSTTFNSTVGDHVSTPTIGWGGLTKVMNEVSYKVEAAATLELEINTESVFSGIPTTKAVTDPTGTCTIDEKTYNFARMTYSAATSSNPVPYFMFRTKKAADWYGDNDSAGKGYIGNTVALTKSIARIEIDVPSAASASAQYGLNVGSSEIKTFNPSETYTTAAGNNQTFVFNVTEPNMTYFAIGCTTTSYNGQFTAIRVYTK